MRKKKKKSKRICPGQIDKYINKEKTFGHLSSTEDINWEQKQVLILKKQTRSKYPISGFKSNVRQKENEEKI